MPIVMKRGHRQIGRSGREDVEQIDKLKTYYKMDLGFR